MEERPDEEEISSFIKEEKEELRKYVTQDAYEYALSLDPYGATVSKYGNEFAEIAKFVGVDLVYVPQDILRTMKF